jgi:translation initiation factor 2 subunit 3
MVNIAACTVSCHVMKASGKEAILVCSQFICAKIGDKLTLSRKVGTTWRLIGWGEVTAGSLN